MRLNQMKLKGSGSLYQPKTQKAVKKTHVIQQLARTKIGAFEIHNSMIK